MVAALTLRGRQLRSWLISSRITGETETERGSERNRRAIASSVVGLVLRGTSFIVVLISVPLTLDLLGPIRFGMWMTIAAVVALLGATDLGIGNGVLNAISRAFGEGDVIAARRYLASGIAVLTGIALALGSVFVVLYPIVPWADLYNVASDPVAASEAGPATAVFVLTFLVGLPLGLVAQTRAAYQEGFIQAAFSGLGNAITVGLLLVAVVAQASLPVLVLAMTTGPLIAAAANWMVLLRIQRPALTPHPRYITATAGRSVVGVGLAFMVLQIAYTIGFTTDRLVVAQVVGPEAVAEYAVVHRLFSVPAGLAAIALLPLWPAYREAITRSDLQWVRVTLRRSIKLTLVATVPLAVAFTLFGSSLVALWTDSGLAPTAALYPAFGAFTIAFGLANAIAMLLNGAQVMRFQIATMTLMAILNLGASIYLAQRIGVAGVALGSVLAIVCALILPAALYVPRLLARFESGHRDGASAAVAEDSK